jgi:hypothetical protein
MGNLTEGQRETAVADIRSFLNSHKTYYLMAITDHKMLMFDTYKSVDDDQDDFFSLLIDMAFAFLPAVGVIPKLLNKLGTKYSSTALTALSSRLTSFGVKLEASNFRKAFLGGSIEVVKYNAKKALQADEAVQKFKNLSHFTSEIQRIFNSYLDHYVSTIQAHTTGGEEPKLTDEELLLLLMKWDSGFSSAEDYREQIANDIQNYQAYVAPLLRKPKYVGEQMFFMTLISELKHDTTFKSGRYTPHLCSKRYLGSFDHSGGKINENGMMIWGMVPPRIFPYAFRIAIENSRMASLKFNKGLLIKQWDNYEEKKQYLQSVPYLNLNKIEETPWGIKFKITMGPQDASRPIPIGKKDESFYFSTIDTDKW